MPKKRFSVEQIISHLREAEFCGVNDSRPRGHADFTDPDFLSELNSIAFNFCRYGLWIMEFEDQLDRRNTAIGPPSASPLPTAN